MEGRGRTPEERRAAAEERARRRQGREQGLPVEEEEEEEAPRAGGWKRPDLGAMTRHYGGPDVYARRRLVAIGVGLLVLLLLFLAFVGC